MAWRERWIRDLNSVPPVLLFLFLINNFVVSVPFQTLTQYIGVDGLNMTSAQQQNYEAFIFMPYSFKPLYAIGLQQSASTSRGLWFMIANFLSGLCFLCKAYWVKTVIAAFLVGFCHNVCMSAAEFCLSASLIDVASRNMKNAGAVQAVLTGCRYFGTFAASILALTMYPCHGGGWTARRVHVLYGFLAIATGLFGVMLRKGTDEEREEETAGLLGNAQEEGLDEGNSKGSKDSSQSKEEEQRRKRWQAAFRIAMMVFALEAVLVWISLQHFIQHSKQHLSQKWAWWLGLGLLSAAGVFALSGAIAFTDGISDVIYKYRRFAPPALFLFFLSCVPQASYQFGFFQTSLFRAGDLQATDPDPSLKEACWPTYIGLATSGAHVVGSFLYAPVANARDVRWVMFFTVLLSSAASLLSIPEVSLTATNQRVHVGSVSFDLFTYAMITGVIASSCGQLALNTKQVIATECCPGKDRVLAYATYLSFLDMGSSVGGWIAAPVVQGLGIDYPHYDPGLVKFIWISAGLSLGVCILGLPFIDVRLSRGERGPRDSMETAGRAGTPPGSNTP